MICFECDGPAQHQHHVVPRVCGGRKTVPLCEKCHGKIHGMSFEVNGLGHSRLTSLGLKAKRNRGEFIGGGIPYGFGLSKDGIRLKRDKDEQATIALAKKIKSQGFSLRATARQLATLGRLSRDGKVFHAGQVARMLVVETR